MLSFVESMAEILEEGILLCSLKSSSSSHYIISIKYPNSMCCIGLWDTNKRNNRFVFLSKKKEHFVTSVVFF